MVTGTSFVIVLFAHWVADFLLQNDWMALNKSKNIFAIASHCALYTVIMIIVLGFFIPHNHYIFVILYLTHMAIDGVSSKACERLYKNGERHWFFVVIGLDQFLHLAILSILFFP